MDGAIAQDSQTIEWKRGDSAKCYVSHEMLIFEDIPHVFSEYKEY